MKEMHDSCQQLFDYCDVYWPRYKSRAEKLVKAAAKAEKSAINAVKYYADSNGNESQFGQMYDAKQDKEVVTLFAQTACLCAAKMTKDVCSVITGGSEITMGMSANESEAINMFGDI